MGRAARATSQGSSRRVISGRPSRPIRFPIQTLQVVKNVDFAGGASKITIQAKGSGKILVYADSLPETIEDESKALAVISFNDASYKTVVKDFLSTVEGLHNLYFVMSNKDICFKSWSVE